MSECTFTVDQKKELCHFVLNLMVNRSACKLLKRVSNSTEEKVLITKTEAREIIELLKSVEKFIVDLPV